MITSINKNQLTNDFAKKTFPLPRKCFFVVIFSISKLLTARYVQFYAKKR